MNLMNTKICTVSRCTCAYIASATLLHVGDLEPPVDSMQVGYHAPMSMHSSSIGSGVVVVPNKYR